jgi:hypothetical protein
VNNSSSRLLERRIFHLGIWLVAGGSLVTWLLFGRLHALSLLVGGALAALNLAWLRATVNAVVLNDQKTSKRRILAGFFLRLLLIPLCLYAMIRFLFWSVPAAVAGFALFHCSIFLEAILETLGHSPEKHERAK